MCSTGPMARLGTGQGRFVHTAVGPRRRSPGKPLSARCQRVRKVTLLPRMAESDTGCPSKEFEGVSRMVHPGLDHRGDRRRFPRRRVGGAGEPAPSVPGGMRRGTDAVAARRETARERNARCGVDLRREWLRVQAAIWVQRMVPRLGARFRKLPLEAGLTGVRLHDLPHDLATRLLTAGVDVRTVAGRLGHRRLNDAQGRRPLRSRADRRAAPPVHLAYPVGMRAADSS